MLVVLIHGYNNSFCEAAKDFAELRARIRGIDGNHDHLYLEVYWDGLYRGPYTAPLPVAYWYDSRAYSLIAGQVGLRRLLNDLQPRIPENTAVRLITHSRGAGVVVGALADAEYDSEIKVPDHESPHWYRNLDLGIALIAPAVDSTDIVDHLSPEEFESDTTILVGFNAADPVLNKIINRPDRFGATRLGVKKDDFCRTALFMNQLDPDLFQALDFGEAVQHGFGYYMNHQQLVTLLEALEITDDSCIQPDWIACP